MQSLRIIASGNMIAGALRGHQIRGVALAGGSAASSAVIFDEATQTGTPILRINSLINDYKSTMFTNDTGIQLKRGLSVTLTGAEAELYLFVS